MDRFKHDSNKLSEALDFTMDEMDEIDFKAMQIVKRDLNESQIMETAIKWTAEKYEDEISRGLALLIMGKAFERMQSMKRMTEMLCKIKDNTPPSIPEFDGKHEEYECPNGGVQFENAENMKKFIDGFKKLLEKYGGVQMNKERDGMIVVRFDDNYKKDEFYKKLKMLEEKYGISGSIKETAIPLSFGGPIAEA